VDELLTIGEFSHACGLSPKVLRSYAADGLLRPALRPCRQRSARAGGVPAPIQEALPGEFLSRVSSIDMLGSMAVYPPGLACAAPLAGALRLRPALALSGLVMMLPALGLLVVPSVRNLTGTSHVYDGHMVV
jgi:MerR family regulatory protein